MKTEKLTLVGLRKQVAQRAGISEAEAERFLAQLFESVTNGLKTDSQVRISGLGTFRVQRNEARRSVNVQTGEPILIEAHNKVIFQPEAMLKDRINLPVVLGQNKTAQGTVAASEKNSALDPLQKLGEQADEIKGILAELEPAEATAVADTTPIKQEETENMKEENKEIEVEQSQPAEEPVIAEEPAKVEEPAKEESVKEEPVEAEAPAPIILSATGKKNSPKTTETSKGKEEKKTHPWLVAGITILVFCILLICAYFFLRHQLTTWANSLLSKDKQKTEVVQPVAEPTETEGTTIEITQEDLDESVSELPAYEYNAFIRTERLNYGSRLALLSRRYYGAPDFWVYIYEANADKISDPNVIRVGTKIRIPKMPKELVDPTNPEALQKAHEMHNRILGNN